MSLEELADDKVAQLKGGDFCFTSSNYDFLLNDFIFCKKAKEKSPLNRLLMPFFWLHNWLKNYGSFLDIYDYIHSGPDSETQVLKKWKENGIPCPSVVEYNENSLLLERILGVTLDAYLKNQSVKKDDKEKMLQELAQVHKNCYDLAAEDNDISFFHPDFKPTNIMVSDDMQLYLIDPEVKLKTREPYEVFAKTSLFMAYKLSMISEDYAASFVRALAKEDASLPGKMLEYNRQNSLSRKIEFLDQNAFRRLRFGTSKPREIYSPETLKNVNKIILSVIK
ncbi:MAG TPA: hypothetical protein ENN46_01400 [Candidatus Woesearchaeota archaeon]|nr:hypothetical protein [Candidatus Woesearchaeota archaeon]